MRVLAGIVEVEGHLFKPSNKYHVLYSPSIHYRSVVACLDPDLSDAELAPHLAPMRGVVVLTSLRGVAGTSRKDLGGMRGQLGVDLPEGDVHVS